MSMRAEVVGAMWLYGQEYSQGRLSAVDFYASLSPDRKRTVGEMVAEIGRAHTTAALERASEIVRMYKVANFSIAPHHRLVPAEPDAASETMAAAIRALCEEE